MTRIRLLLAVCCAVAMLPTALLAQDRGSVTGTVTDAASQRPLAGAQVSIAGTQLGTITNQQGRFLIANVPSGPREVRVSLIGYSAASQTVNVTAGAATAVNFTVTQSAVELEGIIVSAVTGQVERKRELGVNTASINAAELDRAPITKMADVLVGRATGVTLQGAAGTTGSSQRIRIRGANSLSLSNEPLIYIDGVAASNSKGGISLGGQDYSRLNDINPEDIENIEILKGPAASALYGTAAANGVILITTRRGRSGAPVWRAHVETARMEDVNTYPSNWGAVQANTPGAPIFRDQLGQDGELNSPAYTFCPNYRATLPAGTTGACRQDQVLSFNQIRDPRTTPFQTGGRGKVGLSVAGGGDALTYYLSGDQEGEQNVFSVNNLDRSSVRANFGARVGERLNVGLSAAYVRTSLTTLSNDNSIFSPFINAFLGPAQYIPGMESDTVRAAGQRAGSYFGYNTADQFKVTADQSLDRFVTGFNANMAATPWLSLNANVGLDYFSRFDEQTINPGELPLALTYIIGFRDGRRANNYLWTANSSATATRALTDAIASTTTAGVSFQRDQFQGVNCFGAGIPAGTRSCTAATSLFSVSEPFAEERTVGGFFRQQLAFNDRLFLSGSIRGDNNSGLVSGITYYPSANVSWVVSEEPFFPQGEFPSSLRLRGGLGTSGQRPGFGQGETFFSSVAVTQNNLEEAALVLSSTGNPDLRPEKTTEFEVGFDAGVMRDRFSVDFTYYNKESRDALISRPLSPSAGLTGSVWENLGSIRNWGTELGVNALMVDVPNVRFNTRLSATTLQNRIEDIGEGIAPIVFNRGAQAHRQGFSGGAFFALPIMYTPTGTDGRLRVADVVADSSRFGQFLNADGEMVTLPLEYVGPSLPTNTQSLGFDLTLFGNLSVTSLFERRAGHYQLNYTEYFRCRTLDQVPVLSQCAAAGNPDASLDEQAAFIAARFLGATPRGYIEKADFIKWRELSFRIGAPSQLEQQFPMLRGAAVTLSGRNLMTWTDYSGLDPEINETGGSANFTQGEFNTQPPLRTLGIRFDFQF
jgi:TonB-dependent starch-binding outer membrane protein SusC